MHTPALLRNMLVALVAMVILYLGRTVFIPLLYSLLVALVLYPLVAKLERGGVPRWLAIALGLLLVGVVFGGLLGLLAWQVNGFLVQFAELDSASGTGLQALWDWANERFAALGQDHRNAWWTSALDNLPGRITPYLGVLLNGLFGMLFNLFIIPVFTALLLYNRGTYVAAITALVGAAWKPKLPVLLQRVVVNYARFVLGMVQVYLIVGALNTVGFLLLGVPHALLFGLLTAVATMVPYVGILFSALLPITLAYTTTGSLWTPVGVIVVLGMVQYVEANLIFPKVVGGKLGLNTLASLVIIFSGALLWGMAGMILFLPLMSIVMLVSKEVPEWKALRLALGDGATAEGE
ncbi:MAG: AI-2E family transporter [Flavobacteriales bacterium]|nr:AI-2E family transporter [Flavobacteriales bacterium]